MTTYSINYLENLVQDTYELIGINRRFKDTAKEEKYEEYFKEYEIKKSKIYCFISNMTYLLSIFSTLVYNHFSPQKSTYLLIIMITLDILLCGFSRKVFEYSRNLFYLSKYIRYFLLYSVTVYTTILSIKYGELDMSISRFNIMLFFINLMKIYYLEFSYVMIMVVCILNISLIFFIQRMYFGGDFLYNEIISSIFMSLFSFLINKDQFILRRKFFSQLYKERQYLEFIQELVDVLNTMIITLTKENGIIYLNKQSTLFFNKLSKDRFVYNPITTEGLEKNSFKNDDFSNDPGHLKGTIDGFFNSLISNDQVEDFINCKEGVTLSEIISEINTENKYITKEFRRLGYFKSEREGMNNCFEVFLRKMKIKEEITELLIYDVSDIKLAERNRTETKYKQKILAKIAHEFKTPLIAITSLINKLVDERISCAFCKGKETDKLNHMNNLSNYTLILISDIIQYVSEAQMKTHLQEINIKEDVEFCFQVLTTLIQCKLFNTNNVETRLTMDSRINNLKIISNENRLKQILLNFISNSVKFTKTGFIELRTEYNSLLNTVNIVVEDTGIGIKSEDQNMVFQENVQLNFEENYNVKGSGLGLSICKTIAKSLGHEIGFTSHYNKGSKFYISIKCDSAKSHNKHLSINEDMNNSHQNLTEREKNKLTNRNSSCYSERTERRNLNRRNVPEDVTSKKSTEKITLNFRKSGLIKYLKLDDEKDFIHLNRYYDELEMVNTHNFTLGYRNLDQDCSYFVVVDDNKLVRDNTIGLLKIVLNNLNIMNHSIIECADGVDLLKLIINDKENRIKCIFTDESMEYMNGSETVNIIRKLEGTNKINRYYIVSITAFDDQETTREITKSGVDLILTKPCTKSSLTKILKSIGLGKL